MVTNLCSSRSLNCSLLNNLTNNEMQNTGGYGDHSMSSVIEHELGFCLDVCIF